MFPEDDGCDQEDYLSRGEMNLVSPFCTSTTKLPWTDSPQDQALGRLAEGDMVMGSKATHEKRSDPLVFRVHLQLVTISAPSCSCCERYYKNLLCPERLPVFTKLPQEGPRGAVPCNEEAQKLWLSRFVHPMPRDFNVPDLTSL
jgi:hypothetical protein